MNDEVATIWFWQRIVSPHMAGLTTALAELGCDVVYVAEHMMSADRARQGWSAPYLGRARLELAPNVESVCTLVEAAPARSIHICQGIRANGLIGRAQHALSIRCLKQWVVMETVEDSGWRGVAKRIVYNRLFANARPWLDGVLATGHRTQEWVVARGMPENKVFPFAYFLPDGAVAPVERFEVFPRYRFIFVGQLVERKRLDLLISSIGALKRDDVELVVVGSGSEEEPLRRMADRTLPGRVSWLGKMPISAVQAEMKKADCLVLPSRHDGWGAVVSEALMVGTPVICSDACGSAGVVRASSFGGVFPAGDQGALVALLGSAVDHGRLSEQARADLAKWGQSLGAEAGATYLKAVLSYAAGQGARPTPPWWNK